MTSDTIVNNIPAWGNALNVLQERNIPVARVYVHPIYKTTYFHDARSRTYIHVYFANEKGKEVGYYTPCTNNLFIFGQPRSVHPMFLSNIEHPDSTEKTNIPLSAVVPNTM